MLGLRSPTTDGDSVRTTHLSFGFEGPPCQGGRPPTVGTTLNGGVVSVGVRSLGKNVRDLRTGGVSDRKCPTSRFTLATPSAPSPVRSERPQKTSFETRRIEEGRSAPVGVWLRKVYELCPKGGQTRLSCRGFGSESKNETGRRRPVGGVSSGFPGYHYPTVDGDLPPPSPSPIVTLYPSPYSELELILGSPYGRSQDGYSFPRPRTDSPRVKTETGPYQRL